MEEQQRGPAVEETKQSAPADCSGPGTSPVPAATVPSGENAKISIDDFIKVDLPAFGLVKVAERVPKSDKLLRLEVDIGSEVRQVLAGSPKPTLQRYWLGARW